MQLTTEPFDQAKVDKLKRFLEHLAERNQAKPYEIFVDNLKVIPKTEDITEFDNYEDFVSHDTKKIRLVIYNTAASPRNDQYCFLMNGATTEESNGLNGFDSQKGLGAIVEEKLNERDRQHELGRLKEKLEEKEKQLLEAEEFAEGLETRIREMEDGYHRKSMSLVDFGGAVIEQLIRRNPAIANSLPLAGLLGGGGPANTSPNTAQSEDTEASFQPKAAAVTENEQGWITFGQQLEGAFKPDDLKAVVDIVFALAKQPARLPDIIQLLNIQNS